jgi:glycosyltransferase involved in cell wall biosynthesis
MKLGVVITGLGMGGAENHLLKVLPKMKIPLFVISLTNNDLIGKELEKKGIKVYYLGLNKFNLLSIILKFRKIIKKEKPTIIDSYLIHANIFTRLIRPLDYKLINSIRGNYYTRDDFSFSFILKIIERMTRKNVDLFIPNSNTLKKIMIKHNIPKNKIKTLFNGIDLNEIKNRSNEKINDLTFDKKLIYIIYVGSLRHVKNVGIIIKASQFLNNKYKILIIGDGPLKNDLIELSKDGQKIIFLGKKENPLPYLKKSDIFILPSFSEGMSNSLLEAMTLGKNCLVSDIDANKELIGNKEGLTFKVKNQKDLLNKINYLHDNKSNKFGLNAHKKIIKFYDINKVINNYEKILRKI